MFFHLIHEKLLKSTKKLPAPIPGRATGLYFSPKDCGITFQVEALKLFPGRGELIVTGCGPKTKESAQIAFSFIRSLAKDIGIKEPLSEMDLHLDCNPGTNNGDSAGVTFAVAMASALLDQSVRQDSAFTGALSLRGRVKAVGGIREKVWAAFDAGASTVILPKENEKDITDFLDLPITFSLFDKAEDVIRAVLSKPLEGVNNE